MGKAAAIFGSTIENLGVEFRCARCGEKLTDPASIEHGWGPICRKLENVALAKSIPARVEKALAALDAVKLPEGFEPVRAALKEDIAATNDHRATVGVLARIGGCVGLEAQKLGLAKVMDYLGYGVLAAVVLKSASPTPATVKVEAGKLVVSSPKNPNAVAAFKKIPGAWWRPLPKVWVFPLASLRAVVEAVGLYFPTSEVNLTALLVEAGKALEAATPAAPAATAPAAPPAAVKALKCLVTPVADGFTVKSPYNGAYLAELKTLPWTDRKWVPAAGHWWVAAKQAATVAALLSKHYGETHTFQA